MKRLRILRFRRAQPATCFCDACATVTRCDAGRVIASVRDDALTHSLLLR